MMPIAQASRAADLLLKLIPTGRSAEEIDDRGLLSHRVEEPAVIRRVWVGAHECVIDDIITGIDLLVDLTLIVIPDPSTLSREHHLDAQQVCHLPWLENPALRVDQGIRSPPNSNPPRLPRPAGLWCTTKSTRKIRLKPGA
jgi:hypothetical protein